MEFQIVTADTLVQNPALRALDLTLRQPVAGPERELVDHYISTHLPAPPPGQALTVFLEPRLPSSFPDIVAVYWDPAITRRWSRARMTLQRKDVHVLHYVVGRQGAQIEALRAHFPQGLGRSLARLSEACLLERSEGLWQSRPLDDIFAARRIIAIEAKIQSWRKGLQQALMNTWFASEVYLLLPELRNATGITENAMRWGIGVVTSHQTINESVTLARQHSLPISHISWWFNEWIWRTAQVMPSEIVEAQREH